MESKLLLVCLCVALAACAWSLVAGSGAGAVDSWRALFDPASDPLRADIVLKLRLPRTLAAFGTGAALALAGALMQVLLRNPLADPYVLGTSGGAAVAALLAILAGAGGVMVDAAAFGGALLSTLLVFAIAGRGEGLAAERLLLTGVVIAAGWSAAVTLLLAISPDASLRGLLFWLMGDFAQSGHPAPVLIAATLGLAAGLQLSRPLDVLTTGDEQAALLGVEVRRARLILYVLCSLLTALAVTTAGVVGFVGLIVPHFVRLAAGSAHRRLLPSAALIGGALLVLADAAARTVLAPRQLPVGAVTAVLGVPAFLILLHAAYRARPRSGPD
jgi:iron complex transport system permease protein